MDLVTLIAAVLGFSAFLGFMMSGLVWTRKVRALAHVMDDDEDLPEPAIAQIPSMETLRNNPALVDELRGKVDLIGYNPIVASVQGRNVAWEVAESFIVDVNGRIHTLEKKSRHEATVDAEVEDNARWLAEELGVEFRQ